MHGKMCAEVHAGCRIGLSGTVMSNGYDELWCETQPHWNAFANVPVCFCLVSCLKQRCISAVQDSHGLGQSWVFWHVAGLQQAL
jgi:hypothetical protein